MEPIETDNFLVAKLAFSTNTLICYDEGKPFKKKKNTVNLSYGNKCRHFSDHTYVIPIDLHLALALCARGKVGIILSLI